MNETWKVLKCYSCGSQTLKLRGRIFTCKNCGAKSPFPKKAKAEKPSDKSPTPDHSPHSAKELVTA